MQKLLNEMRADVRSFNSQLGDEKINKMSFKELDAYVHPLYRNDYQEKYNKLNKEEKK